jgi:hypothetical protein
MVEALPSLQRRKARVARVKDLRARKRAAIRAWLRSRRGAVSMSLAAAVALPAFAAPGDWDRFEIGNAEAESIVVQPMPFEKAGSSFPGSAFYYLSMEQDEPRFGEGIRSDADDSVTPNRVDPGPSASPMTLQNWGIDRTRALSCLTAAVYYEAASEPDIGQRAVAQVVLNRVAHPAYPNTVCGVVYQGSQRKTGCQFTFTCDGALARRPNAMFWARAEAVARDALAGYVHAPAGLATHYHTIQINPYWAPSLHYLGTIGAHRFYNFKGKAGLRSTFRFAYAGSEPDSAALRGSAIARESETALNPVTLQNAYDDGLRKAQAANAAVQHPAPAPLYTRELRDRGGDQIYQGQNLPETSGIKAEYRNSGRWIARPGT